MSMSSTNMPPLSSCSWVLPRASTARLPHRRGICVQAVTPDDFAPGKRVLDTRNQLLEGEFGQKQAETLLEMFPSGSSLATYFAKVEEKQQEKERQQLEKEREKERLQQEKEREKGRQQLEKEFKELRQFILGAYSFVLLGVLVICPPGSPLQNFIIFVLSKLT